MRILLIILLIILLYTTQAHAQVLDSEFNAWSVFSTEQDNEKICYITSVAISKMGNYKRRGEPYILITYKKDGVSEVSTSSGYQYKDDSTVTLTIGDAHKFELFITSETPKIAWAKDAAEDKSIIEEMFKGTELSVSGTSQLGTFSKDTYSLYGFTKAYNRMQALCK